MPEDKFDSLAKWLATQLNAESIRIDNYLKLSGGAIQENWHLELSITENSKTFYETMVLRTDSFSKVSASHNRIQEFAVQKFVFEQGIQVPEPLFLCEDDSVIGNPFYVMRYCSGTTNARTIVRHPELAQIGPGLAEQLGRELGKLHSITPPAPKLTFLNIPKQSAAEERITTYRGYLDELSVGRPALEYALNWLEDNNPNSNKLVLCHCDFRTGNYLVNGNKLEAILDWEFVAWSDPYEDIGWFCARCWRFGNDMCHAGGIAQIEDFVKGYVSTNSKTVIDRKLIAYWQVMAEVRWAIIALQQASRTISEQEVSLELALTGRMVAEMELNALTTIKGIEEHGNEG